MTLHIALVLGILAFTTLLFISNKVRVDVVAVLVLALIGALQLAPPEQLFSGFSSEAVMSLIAIMIIGKGMEHSGISIHVARWILSIGKERPRTILVLLMFITGIMSSFMRSLGTVALLLPIVNRIAARTGISKSYLLMPMAFCAILGGTITMVGTGPLIILNSLLRQSYDFADEHERAVLTEPMHPFQLLDIAPIGIFLLIVGIVYLWILNSKTQAPNSNSKNIQLTRKANFKRIYNKDGDIFELKVLSNSAIDNMTVTALESLLPQSCSIIAISQNNNITCPPLRKEIIKAPATIALMGDKEIISNFAKQHELKLLPHLHIFTEFLHPIRAGLCEAFLPPSSQLIGAPANELHMRRTYGIQVLALCRGNNVYHGDELSNLTLRSGDSLGMFSCWESLAQLQNNSNFFVLTTSYPREKLDPTKLPYAIFFFFLAMILVLTETFAISVGLLLGAVGMIATRVLSIDQAYSAVSWKTVFLLAGLLPLGVIIQTSGTTEWLAYHLVPQQTMLTPIILQTIVAIISSCTALVLSNIGATILLVPIAIELAINLGQDPRMYALIVALSASNTFILPTNQVNALISGPGHYTIKDFFKTGGLMTIMFWVVVLTGIKFVF